jgi:hypothetical protein
MSPVSSTETFNRRRLIVFLLYRNLQSQEIDYFLIWVMIDNFLYYYSRVIIPSRTPKTPPWIPGRLSVVAATIPPRFMKDQINSAVLA